MSWLLSIRLSTFVSDEYLGAYKLPAVAKTLRHRPKRPIQPSMKHVPGLSPRNQGVRNITQSTRHI